MLILAIETSCDETALALVETEGELNNPQFKILENLVASQIKIHRPFGGVVPNLAKREHLKNLPILLSKILKAKSYKLKANLDLIAVTVGPGLEPALWTGINFAKELYSKLKTHNSKLKLVGVSHLEGHLYSFLLSHTKEALPYREARKESQWKESQWSNIFPAIHLLVSGGHTILILMKDLIHYKKLGETRDDAVGEAFDKVARLLDLPYPGGPEIEKFAKKGNSEAINFPRPMMNQKNYDFSFSGLKTAVLYYLKNNENLPLRKDEASLSDVAASFQQAAFDVLISKTLRAVEKFKAKSIMISGGVAANKTLKKEFQKAIKFQFSNSKIPQLLITEFPTDNAAMIAVAGHINYLRKKNRRLIARGNLSI
ncbi:MAG: tRNA (adenosine(37)-N6)-threonylcarbamoyltransferase complex transferase subunit TsaD [Patescibacteria group bacterium]